MGVQAMNQRALDVLRRVVNPDPWDTQESIRRDAELVLSAETAARVAAEQARQREKNAEWDRWIANYGGGPA